MENFIHLHVHTQYSLLDGQARIPKLVEKAIKDGMRGMAITDHGNIMGVKEYFNYVNKKNKALKEEGKEPFKPIFGCEMYVAERTLYDRDKDIDSRRYHLIVLAKNEQGYHNLIKLVSKSWIDGFYGRPRTDHNELEKYHEGLIVCSACLAGEVPRRILAGDIKGAEAVIEWYKGIFGDDYYLEIQRHEVKDPTQRANRETFPLQQESNKVILELAKKHGVERQVYYCTGSYGRIQQWRKLVPDAHSVLWLYGGNWRKLDFSDTEERARRCSYMKKSLDAIAAKKFEGLDLVELIVVFHPTDPSLSCPDAEFVKREVARIRAAGKKPVVLPWTEGDKTQTYSTVAGWGVDIFGTDYPETLQEYLK